MFTTTNGVKAINGFAKMKKKLDAEVFKLTGIKPEPGEGYTVHDFRRTAATNIAKMGVPPHVLSGAAEPHSRSRAGRDRNIQSLQVHGGTSGRTRTVGRPGDQAGRREKTENSVESPTMSKAICNLFSSYPTNTLFTRWYHVQNKEFFLFFYPYGTTLRFKFTS